MPALVTAGGQGRKALLGKPRNIAQSSNVDFSGTPAAEHARDRLDSCGFRFVRLSDEGARRECAAPRGAIGLAPPWRGRTPARSARPPSLRGRTAPGGSRPARRWRNLLVSSWISLQLGAVAGAVASAARRVRLDGAAGGCNHVPLGAEVGEPFALRLTGSLVAHEPIERMPCIRHLPASVLSLREAEHGFMYTRLSTGLSCANDRRPIRNTGGVARTPAVVVFLEQVERPSPSVDEYRAERCFPECDERASGCSRR
jgi:hypothetical protein